LNRTILGESTLPRSTFLPLALLGLALAFNTRADGPQAEAADSPSPFALFVADYFDAYFAHKPSEGTAAGLRRVAAQFAGCPASEASAAMPRASSTGLHA
jgi:hypothetical protein